jgi:rhodanese-related sulfurtransferase
VVDVREEGAFTAADHLLYASSLPLSRLELSAPDLLPRRDVRLVAMDADETLAPRAARRLAELGYADVSVLTGGVAAWKAAGFPVYRGAHVPSKAFAELVEHLDGTPWIDVQTLRAKQAAGEDLVVLDTRSFPEYRNQTIPGAISAPGAEIVDVLRDLAPSPDTLVVAGCGGRTRSIIGAQALIAAGLPNRVVSLQNGTMGWTLAGLSVETGAMAGRPDPHLASVRRPPARRIRTRPYPRLRFRLRRATGAGNRPSCRDAGGAHRAGGRRLPGARPADRPLVAASGLGRRRAGRRRPEKRRAGDRPPPRPRAGAGGAGGIAGRTCRRPTR